MGTKVTIERARYVKFLQLLKGHLRPFFILIFLLSFCFISCTRDEQNYVHYKKSKDFPLNLHVINIDQYSHIGLPCVFVEVSGKKLLLEVDLGFNGVMSILDEDLSEIHKKEVVGSRVVYGIKDYSERVNIYRVPVAKLGTFRSSNLRIESENKNFIVNSEITKNRTPKTKIQGRIGWKFFKNSLVLFDLNNSFIGIAETKDSLKYLGYNIENYTKASLVFDQDMLEMEGKVAGESVRCLLDTGSTWNVWNSSTCTGNVRDPVNQITSASFEIAGVDFGPIDLKRVNLRLPIKIEAILGMEFFKQNLIVLDLKTDTVYISK